MCVVIVRSHLGCALPSFRTQNLYTSAEMGLDTRGGPVRLNSVSFNISQVPAFQLTNFRIGIAFVPNTTTVITEFLPMTIVYGPVNVSRSLMAVNQYVFSVGCAIAVYRTLPEIGALFDYRLITFPIGTVTQDLLASQIVWDPANNLVLELSYNNPSFDSSGRGGLWRFGNNIRRSLRAYSDFFGSYPYTTCAGVSINMYCANATYVPVVIFGTSLYGKSTAAVWMRLAGRSTSLFFASVY